MLSDLGKWVCPYFCFRSEVRNWISCPGTKLSHYMCQFSPPEWKYLHVRFGLKGKTRILIRTGNTLIKIEALRLFCTSFYYLVKVSKEHRTPRRCLQSVSSLQTVSRWGIVIGRFEVRDQIVVIVRCACMAVRSWWISSCVCVSMYNSLVQPGIFTTTNLIDQKTHIQQLHSARKIRAKVQCTGLAIPNIEHLDGLRLWTWLVLRSWMSYRGSRTWN